MKRKNGLLTLLMLSPLIEQDLELDRGERLRLTEEFFEF